MDGVNLANQSRFNSRRKLDYYPTPENVTRALMDFLKLEACDIWEPACGDGAMAEVLKSYGHQVVSTDIRETGYGQGDINFLEHRNSFDAIITNPPFNVSEQFITHALDCSPIVAMLLKSQYWHAARRTQLFNENPPAYVLALNWRPDFLDKERGGAPTMEMNWTVWIHGNTDTRYRILSK